MGVRRRKRNKVGAALLPILCLALALLLFLRWHGAGMPEETQETEPPAASTQAAAIAQPAPETDMPAPTPELPAETKPPLTPPQGYSEESYRLVSDMAYTYAYQQDAGAEIIRNDLAALRELDPALGALWEKLMACWEEANSGLVIEKGLLPDGLAEDDSLCIVVLGFQLHADGSMSEELAGRCEVALACAEKYPEALIAVTGGGTAWQNPAATEAGVMAAWLTDHGVDPGRILIEDASRTTADNAEFTCALLQTQYPQVRQLAVVSSDYHVPLGVLLFEEWALLREYETGTLPFTVAACAAWDTQGSSRPDSPAEQKSYLWALADPSY